MNRKGSPASRGSCCWVPRVPTGSRQSANLITSHGLGTELAGAGTIHCPDPAHGRYRGHSVLGHTHHHQSKPVGTAPVPEILSVGGFPRQGAALVFRTSTSYPGSPERDPACGDRIQEGVAACCQGTHEGHVKQAFLLLGVHIDVFQGGGLSKNVLGQRLDPDLQDTPCLWEGQGRS